MSEYKNLFKTILPFLILMLLWQPVIAQETNPANPDSASSKTSESATSTTTVQSADGAASAGVPPENIEPTDETIDPVEDMNDVEEENLEPQTESLFDVAARGGLMMIPLAILGILGLTLVVERSIFHYKNMSWKNDSVDNLLEGTAKSAGLKYSEELEKKLDEVSRLYLDKLEKGMGLLQGVGNLAPLLGFLGTVIGMISAFSAIAAARTVNAKVVASGIQVALVTTAGGLIVAVPVLAAFYLFAHVLQNHQQRATVKISELTSKLPSMMSDESKG